MAVLLVPAGLSDQVDGRTRLSLPGTTVRQVLDVLTERWPVAAARLRHNGGLRPFVRMFVDGRDVDDVGLDCPVGDDSEVLVLMAVSGG